MKTEPIPCRIVVLALFAAGVLGLHAQLPTGSSKMDNNFNPIRDRPNAAGHLSTPIAPPDGSAIIATGFSTSPVAISQLGAKAIGDYHGDALIIEATADGARLRAGFQKLSGLVTSEGLTLISTESGGGQLCLVAACVGRTDEQARHSILLSHTGDVVVSEKAVVFKRQLLSEELSVSADGVRQDFLIAERPAGTGDLYVELSLTGAKAEAASYGAKLTFEGSCRELAYSRLMALDATGRELNATLKVLSANSLAVRVADASAVYPVRIDPTFSDADWVSINPGIPGTDHVVYAAAADTEGNLYIGGAFSVAGNVVAQRVAKWNGSEWSALGSGINGNYVLALAVSGSDLYAGGDFGVLKWNGAGWSALGATFISSVRALVVSGTDLYAGGDFVTPIDGVPANYIAKWNGTEWSVLGTGMNGSVMALTAIGSDLYAGGRFTTAGGIPANYIAKWDGSTWSPLGSGMTDWVYALAAHGSELFAGGAFLVAGGVMTEKIAKWDGTTWSALGSGITHSTSLAQVDALVVSGNALYVGGNFTTAGGKDANDIAKWEDNAWSALGSGVTRGLGITEVFALVTIGSELYAGGDIKTIGGSTANHVAKWNGSTWSALGSGLNDAIQALAVIGTDLYAGGYFTTAGSVVANRIAKWDGSSWSALGSGVAGDSAECSVKTLAVKGADLYAGGIFDTAGGVPAKNVAKWNGISWSALGSGVGEFTSDGVYSFALDGSDLFVGGIFNEAGGVPALNIAKWNGSTWSALGEGVLGPVLSLALVGTNLYVGGNFFATGGIDGILAYYIVKRDGSAWSTLGSGLNNVVTTLVVDDTGLYVGGAFSMAGGSPASGVAKWDGSAWSALGSGIVGTVKALAIRGNEIYAGGKFFSAGGSAAKCIVKWDGVAWSTLGSEAFRHTAIDPDVRALALDASGHLFLGGDFVLAGTTVSPWIALANVGSVNVPPIAPVQMFIRGFDRTLKIRIADLLSACSDPDGGTPVFESVGNSAQSATISTTGTHILYSLASNASDSFPYTVSDGQGGSTAGSINVELVHPGGRIRSVNTSGGSVAIHFAGIPDFEYDIQRATDPGGPWTVVDTQTAPARGLFNYTDPSPPQPTAYYRLIEHSQ